MRLAAAATICFAVLVCAMANSVGAANIRNHTTWLDTSGNLIDCHEGSILRVGNTFYWYGRIYHGNDNGIYGKSGAQFRCGLNCYSSTDLVSWTYRGVILSYPASGWVTEGTWHRPRVLYNDQTKKYVLWFFVHLSDYPCPLVVATADSPTGPFTILGAPTSGVTMGGDLALYKEAAGQAYLATGNAHADNLVYPLAADYLTSNASPVTAMLNTARTYEAASMVRYMGKYIVAGSFMAGLAGSDTSYSVADAPMGPYTAKGLMSQPGTNTWNSQISSFFYLAESNRLIALCEQWLTGPNGEWVIGERSSQLWLPVTFDPAAGIAQMQNLSEWDPWAGDRPPGLRGYWKLDETAGTTAADSSGSGNTGTLLNGPAWTPGKLHGALHFDGVNDRMSCGMNGMPAPNEAQTEAFWLRFDTAPTAAQAAVALGTTSSGVYLGFHTLDGGGVKLGAWRYGGPYFARTAVPAAHRWHHAAYVFDGTTHRLYLNGSLADSSTVAPQTPAPSALSLGGLPWNAEFFKGDLDDVRVYNRALSADEVAALARAGNAIVQDTFTNSSPGANYADLPGQVPDVANLPGETWVQAAGFGYAPPQIPSAATGDVLANAARLGENYTGMAISLAGVGAYTKPAMLTISADVMITGGSAGTGGVALGFYADVPQPDAGAGELDAFTGLKLSENGTLTLYADGMAGQAAAGPPINRSTYYNLSYDVDTASGAIFNVMLQGSTGTHGFTTSAFTDAATGYGAFVVSGGQGAQGGMDNFVVSEAVGGSVPQVSITVPAANTTFAGGSDLAVTAAAADLGGAVVKVEFYRDGVKFAEDTTGPFTATWVNVPQGQHTLTAVATDNDGSMTVSAPLTIKAVIPGDANGDGSVDGLDYNDWQNGYQQPNPTFATGDYNGDGAVDGLDYNVWQNNYSKTATY